MTHVSWPRLVAALLFSSAAYFVWVGTVAASRPSDSVGVELDHLIPREKWEGIGLNKLTVPEQQTLANEITSLLGAARSTETASSAQKDRSQWRKLQRHMTKEDVRKLLGEPMRISVTRFYEAWDYAGGSVTFDGKGRVDSWSEL
jgi:hypothetical protein